jgi:hypothetical protein
MVDLDMRLKSNVGAERVSHDWLFFVDANEIVGEDLATDLSRWKTPKQRGLRRLSYRNYSNNWITDEVPYSGNLGADEQSRVTSSSQRSISRRSGPTTRWRE